MIRFWWVWVAEFVDQNYHEAYVEARKFQQGWTNLVLHLTKDRND